MINTTAVASYDADLSVSPWKDREKNPECKTSIIASTVCLTSIVDEIYNRENRAGLLVDPAQNCRFLSTAK